MNWDYLFRKYTRPFRCLPDFLIVGAQKAGTTSLLYYLSQHPDVYVSPLKEINYFNLEIHRPLNEYRHYFPLQIERLFRKNLKAGEATPDYMIYRQVPEAIAKVLPDVKIIMLLRNPADRVFSHYGHNLMMKREWLSLEDALKYEDIRTGKDYIDIYKCKKDAIKNYSNYNYKARGIYYEQIVWFLQYFDKSNLLVLQSEAFFNNPLQSVNETLRFMGLTELTSLHAEPQNQQQVKVEKNETLRNELIEYYKPYNEKLFALIEKRFDWK